jgi:Yip1 domain
MSSTETIRPLKDVWLRPRRVFRELAPQPIALTDYVLAGAQGVAASIAVYRTPLGIPGISVMDILGKALLFGPVGGILSVLLFVAIYTRLGAKVGGKSVRSQVFHVLAYSGLPVIATLLLWAVTACLVGDAAVVAAPAAQKDGFVAVVLQLQSLGYAFLLLWGVVLQVMGFSEIQGLATGRAFGVWLLGQFAVAFGVLMLGALAAGLFGGAVPAAP